MSVHQGKDLRVSYAPEEGKGVFNESDSYLITSPI